jgi:hypothetical protein
LFIREDGLCQQSVGSPSEPWQHHRDQPRRFRGHHQEL